MYVIRLIFSRNSTFSFFYNICIIVNGSSYIMRSRRESQSKYSSILSIFLVIAYASVKAIDDNLLRWQQQLQLAAANFAKGGISITPEHALCYIQYSARYLQNNLHAGLLCQKHAVTGREEGRDGNRPIGLKTH